MHILINNKYLIYKDFKVKCALGTKGIDYKKKEGDQITPKGNYRIKYILYRKDRIKKIKTKFKVKIIRKNMGWCDDPSSAKYNKIISIPFSFSFEKLFRKDNIYDIILVLNYNMNPIKKKKGSAIFIHVAKSGYKKTKGCIAIKKKHLIKLLKLINPKTRITICSQK